MDTTVQVALITTLGLIIAAIIGVRTAKITYGARDEAKTKAQEASKSAKAAQDYAEALEERKAAAELLEARLERVEQHHRDCTDRLEEMKRRLDESDQTRQLSGIIEHDQHEEIKKLQAEVETLKRA